MTGLLGGNFEIGKQRRDPLVSAGARLPGNRPLRRRRRRGSFGFRLDFNGPRELQRVGIHTYADGLQKEINKIGQQIFETYVLLPAEVQQLPAPSYAIITEYQQQQQQQQ